MWWQKQIKYIFPGTVLIMETYFNTEYLYLGFDRERQLGHAIWNGFLNSEEFRAACEACLNLLATHQPVNWLADNRKMKAIRQHDQDWFVQEIIPQLAQSTIRKMATLVSEDIFNQMAVESLEAKANDVVLFDNHHFKSEAEALQWLAAPALENQTTSGLD